MRLNSEPKQPAPAQVSKVAQRGGQESRTLGQIRRCTAAHLKPVAIGEKFVTHNCDRTRSGACIGNGHNPELQGVRELQFPSLDISRPCVGCGF